MHSQPLHFIPPALSNALLQRMHAYWQAANYLSVGQIYLYDNPLLKQPLALAQRLFEDEVGEPMFAKHFAVRRLNFTRLCW